MTGNKKCSAELRMPVIIDRQLLRTGVGVEKLTHQKMVEQTLR
jgi:hypothetical protein